MTGPAPFGLNVPDTYQKQLIAWGQAKIAAGADPDVVNSLVQDKVHAYRASLGQKPETLGAETPGERAAGAISAAYQGMTLGAGNKITAGIRTVLPQALGGVKGFDFPEALKEQTQVLEEYKQRHPVASTVMDVAGSALPIAATAGLAGPLEGGLLARSGKLAATGAAYGGATGALSSNQLSDVPGNTMKGAAVGAIASPVVGMTVPPIVRGATNLVRRIAPANAIAKAAAELSGAGPVTPEEKATEALRGALQKGGVNPEEAASTLATGSPTTALDLGSQPALKLARQARNVPTSNAGQTLDDFLEARAAGAGQRIEKALTTGAGATNVTDTDLPVEQLIARRAEEAKPLYQAAEAYGEIKNPETIQKITTLLKVPKFRQAWNRGQDLAAVEAGDAGPTPGNMAPQQMFKALIAQGVPAEKAAQASGTSGEATGPTVAQINNWKKGLDAQIEAGAGSVNAMSRNEARVYRNKLSEILDMVDQEVPAFAKARAAFRGTSELAEAADAGANHFSPGVKASYLARTLPEMSDGEQEAYRMNALNAAAQKIRSMAANPDLPEAARKTNVVQRLMGSNEEGQKLRMLFPDENSYQGFLKQMQEEASYPPTNRFLTQQSSTAAQLAENQVSPGMLRDVALSPISNYAKVRLGERALHGVGLLNRGMQPAVSDAIARQGTLTGEPLQNYLTKMGNDATARELARRRLGLLLGNVGAAQGGQP